MKIFKGKIDIKYFNNVAPWSYCNIKLRLRNDNYWNGKII